MREETRHSSLAESNGNRCPECDSPIGYLQISPFFDIWIRYCPTVAGGRIVMDSRDLALKRQLLKRSLKILRRSLLLLLATLRGTVSAETVERELVAIDDEIDWLREEVRLLKQRR